MELTLSQLKDAAAAGLPGLLGIDVYDVGEGIARARLELGPRHQAPNGYLHAGTVVSLADSASGYGCILNLPEGAIGFTTIELKTNFLRSAQTGTIECEARLAHGGRTTQVWDATVTDPSGRQMALFRCTQLLLR
ncbi:MAG: PaaI family thioesterase [Actinobacteria bacterium]|nr:PaaI family thioesterase [Actinomycetota bacterium]